MPFKIHEDINSVFTLSGPCQKLFGPERKALINACLLEGGEYFKDTYIPMRFTDYAYRLGYRVTDRWKQEKRRVLQSKRALPYIGMTPAGGGDAGAMVLPTHNGEKMSVAMARGCRVDVSGTSRGGNIIIKTPYGHAILPPLAAAFNTVLPAEYQAVTRVVATALRAFLAYARPPSKRSKKLTIAGASDNWTPRGREVAKRDGAGAVTHRKTG